MTRFQPRTALVDDLTSDSGQLRAQLGKLGLYSMATQFEAEADRAAKSESSYTSYLRPPRRSRTG